jgi:hypothetical protein
MKACPPTASPAWPEIRKLAKDMAQQLAAAKRDYEADRA